MDDKEREQLQQLHDFFMKPPVPGKPTRAQRIDDVLTAVTSGKMTMRVILWAAGALVAVGAAWSQLKGWK